MTDQELRSLLDADPRVALYSLKDRIAVVLWSDPTLWGLSRGACSSDAQKVLGFIQANARSYMTHYECGPGSGDYPYAPVDLDAFLIHITRAATAPAPGPDRFPHRCRCGSSAYIGLLSVECSRSGCPGLAP